jgi:hypothetical protein
LLDEPPHRSVELNFLIMLGLSLADCKTTVDPELIATAIRVRRLAERATLGLPEMGADPARVAGGPAVSAWIRRKVDEGDVHRREADDLLTATGLGPKAADSYRMADRAYREAIEGAGKVRRAMLARDRVLADLIPFTEWLAGRRPPRAQAELLETSLAKTEALWEQVHQLCAALEEPAFERIDRIASTRDGSALGLVDLATRIEQGMADLKERTIVTVSSFYLSNSKRPFDLNVLAEALAIPWLPLDLRRRMLDSILDIADLEETVVRVSKEAEPEITVDANEKEAGSLIRIRGRMALAILGRDAFRVGVGGDGVGYEALRRQIEEAVPGTADGRDEARWSSPAKLGGEVGNRFAARVARIAGLTDAPAAPKEAGSPEPLAEAERLLRLLDDVSSEHVETRALISNAFGLLRMVDYLAWQADRALGDLWVDDSDRPLPFDHRVAAAYLDDAVGFDRALHDVRGGHLAAWS